MIEHLQMQYSDSVVHALRWALLLDRHAQVHRPTRILMCQGVMLQPRVLIDCLVERRIRCVAVQVNLDMRPQRQMCFCL